MNAGNLHHQGMKRKADVLILGKDGAVLHPQHLVGKHVGAIRVALFSAKKDGPQTFDAATKRMESDPRWKEMPEMPFDGKRMIWGGFAPIFDTAA